MIERLFRRRSRAAVPGTPTTGLLLTGGGARAAYQVGVLEGIAELAREAGVLRNPFDVITGTSAGAVNAAALACGADHFGLAVRRIAAVWHDLQTGQVYDASALSLLDVNERWRLVSGLAQLLLRWRREQPRSLLDNRPMSALLEALVPLERLPQVMAEGHLKALAVTASSYGSGLHFCFYDAVGEQAPWVRSQRLAVPGRITHEHLMASAAIPFLFPAVPVQRDGRPEYFGDGSMRQSAPISPAIHLGAERVLVVGSGRLQEPPDTAERDAVPGYPSLAQIAGHALSSIFLDALAADIERLRRINHTLAQMPPEARAATRLRPVELLVISPSQRLDAIAARHAGALPGVVHRMLTERTEGHAEPALRSSMLASYLLFDAGFTRELMALGRADTQRQRDEVMRFFGWTVAEPARSRFRRWW